MNKKTKGSIIQALRKLTFSHKPRDNTKKKQKVGPAAYKCEMCAKIIYTGKRDLDIAKKILNIQEKTNIEKGKIYIDHIDPVIPLEGFPNKKWDWNIYIERMFCDEDGLQVLCRECHDEKTAKENSLRKK